MIRPESPSTSAGNTSKRGPNSAGVVHVAHRFPIRRTLHRNPGEYLLSPTQLLTRNYEDFFPLCSRLSQRLGTPALVLVTSARHAEGRTITALNLSTALSHASARAIYVEADFRRPALHTFFQLPVADGLAQLLREPLPMSDMSAFLLPTDIAGLDLLPAGIRAATPGLLDSPRLDELFTWLRAEADWIIIDCPPLLTYDDALPLLEKVDGVVATALEGRTCEQDLAALSARLASGRAPVVDTVSFEP